MIGAAGRDILPVLLNTDSRRIGAARYVVAFCYERTVAGPKEQVAIG